MMIALGEWLNASVAGLSRQKRIIITTQTPARGHLSSTRGRVERAENSGRMRMLSEHEKLATLLKYVQKRHKKGNLQ